MSAQGVTNFGTIEFTYVKQDGARVAERRNIDIDAYVASGGSTIMPLQSTEISVCDLAESPLTPKVPRPAPPPNTPDIPSNTSMVEIYQSPLGGVGDWYQKVQYHRTGHPKADGTWDSPGHWGNPAKIQVHAQIPNLPCETSSE